MRWFHWTGVSITLLVGLYLAWIPAQATVLEVQVWPASKTSELAAEALGSTVADSRIEKAHFIRYSIHFSSMVPFRIDLLNPQPIGRDDGVNVYPAILPFSQNAHRFQRTGVAALFIVEPNGQDPHELARNLRFTLRSGTNVWPRIPVKIPSSIPVVDRTDDTFR